MRYSNRTPHTSGRNAEEEIQIYCRIVNGSVSNWDLKKARAWDCRGRQEQDRARAPQYLPRLGHDNEFPAGSGRNNGSQLSFIRTAISQVENDSLCVANSVSLYSMGTHIYSSLTYLQNKHWVWRHEKKKKRRKKEQEKWNKSRLYVGHERIVAVGVYFRHYQFPSPTLQHATTVNRGGGGALVQRLPFLACLLPPHRVLR
ncbi:hypothetical protein CCUS01_04484 [Colletotrichum cuscutae]|uniref:Uncharacterized protein n=1 Tax=Colletotrichum cuscutae TaxID=1209917 RepID=A0AAI9VDS5_9PEZI|nr:hypothetical protein CCUS01_04484 [Colletotrichum cuscutae]